MTSVLAAAAMLAALSTAPHEADAGAVIAYYEDMARALWVGPCGTVVPHEAGRFRTAYDTWRVANETLIARGEVALRDVPAGAAAADDDATADEFVAILRELPVPDALAFCERQFGLRGYDDAVR
ncbi:MAG TPA: hypothetical protein VFL14_01335 [Xanthomonadales bacterium]|nr:hypothetical protein [Xanthomonadales bacterium]